MLTIKVLAFIIITLALAVILRKSLRDVHTHGFFRFFAWESIILLFLMNIDFWFESPFSWYQMISWILLISSGIYVIQGTRLLYTKGRPDATRSDENLYTIEKTTKLVSEGIYNYIRHPLYASLLFLTWGIYFKYLSVVGTILASAASVSLILTAKLEEKENCVYFGEGYTTYMQKTKMFIPFLW